MKFQSVSQSKRHAKFYDVRIGEIFFVRGFAYMKTSHYEDDDNVINAVRLDGFDKGALTFFDEEDDVDILKSEVVINYKVDEVLSWV